MKEELELDSRQSGWIHSTEECHDNYLILDNNRLINAKKNDVMYKNEPG